MLVVRIRPTLVTSMGPFSPRCSVFLWETLPFSSGWIFLHSPVYELPTILCGLHPAFSWQLESYKDNMWSGIKCGIAACVVYVFSRGKWANWSVAFLFLITFLFPFQASLFCMLTCVPLEGEFKRLMNRTVMFKNKPKFCNETCS